MIFVILVLAILIVIWSAGRGLIQIQPGSLARLARKGAVAACFLIAFLFALRGQFEISLLALGAVWLIEGSIRFPRLRFGAGKLRGVGGSGAGAVSTFRTAMIEMRVDHATGGMRGSVLAGAFAGRELELLNETQLAALALECAKFDAEGARLLQAYLDRRFAGRRENAYAHADSGPARRRSGAMTAEEAYEVLGLSPGAPDDAVRRAYRDLMKKLHPDQGGSTYLAARVNQARDVLLNRHR
ncbi:MAG: DnaJ domain-containing protein [Hyphomicrobiales bacterium]|nr:DnaJ domain-containing protein [Hyphomicrobiales bacterium]MBV9519472.1 DnaJ domain-containing protein [Hyphomicrobiales bacterium]